MKKIRSSIHPDSGGSDKTPSRRHEFIRSSADNSCAVQSRRQSGARLAIADERLALAAIGASRLSNFPRFGERWKRV